MTDENKQLFVPEVYLDSEGGCQLCSFEEDLPKKSSKGARKELELVRRFAKDVKFSGEDVTDRADIFEIVSYAKELGFLDICIESSGRRFRDTGYLRKMLESGASSFSIFIHGHNQDLQEKFTGVKGGFEETLNGISNMAKNPSMNFSVNIILTNLNYEKLPEIVDFSRRKGFKKLEISFAAAFGCPIKKEAIPRISDVIPYLKKALDSSSGKNPKVSFIPPCFLAGYEKCMNFSGIPSKTKIANPNFTIFIESELRKKMRKGDECKKCRFDKICTGLWGGYAELYGFSELRAVEGKKLESVKEFRREFE